MPCFKKKNGLEKQHTSFPAKKPRSFGLDINKPEKKSFYEKFSQVDFKEFIPLR